jgi:flagellar biosynthesis/type III secretory pathway protein FliH
VKTSPFLGTLPTPAAAKPLCDVLPAHDVPTGSSPWSPKVAAAPAAPIVDVESLRARAIEDGRAVGRRETDQMRERLVALLGELERERAADHGRVAELVADAAVAVIETWLDRGLEDRRDMFAPIVRGWLQKTGDGGNATAYVNPAEVAAMRAAVGDAMIAVEADAKVKPGDVRVRGATIDTTHEWRERLDELRHAIATEIATPRGADR